MRLNFLECPWLDCSAVAQRMEQRCHPQGDCIAAFVLSPELLLLRYIKAWLNEFVINGEIAEMLFSMQKLPCGCNVKYLSLSFVFVIHR